MNTIIVTEETIYSGIFFSMFDDILASEKTIIVNRYLDEENILRKVILDFLYKNRINSVLRGSFESIFKPNFSLGEKLSEFKGEKSIVIFTNASLQKVYSKNNLNKLRKSYPEANFILLLVDSIFQPQAKNAVKLIDSGIFDLVYTYNRDDAKKLNCLYWPTPYSYLKDVVPEIVENGVYFCGSDKGRAEQLDRIANKFKELGINYQFDVFGDYKKYQNFIVKSYDLKDYKEVLKNTLKYSTILDICQESDGENCGLSLRVYESIVYGRVLITNNKSIKDFEYYDPSYMHYIEKVDDIKLEWIKNCVKDKYSGSLSPKYLIEDIKKRLL